MGNLTRQVIGGRERYVATDIDLEHPERLRTRLARRPALETAICDLSNSAHFTSFAGAMDTVVCLNVLEHVKGDLQCLRNIHSALAPQGRAVVLVPCDQGLYGKLDEILGHERRYCADELRTRRLPMRLWPRIDGWLPWGPTSIIGIGVRNNSRGCALIRAD